MDEGYIKFHVEWTRSEAFAEEDIRELNHWRDRMYRLGLIGAYDNGIGFGNISRRWDDAGRFLISGSATGNLRQLQPKHYALVTSVAIESNRLYCQGPLIASSESMSHAMIYQQQPEVNAVIHVHHLALWKKLLHRVPTTDSTATYGSPEMAYAILELLKGTDLPKTKVFVMEGHQEGIFSFGECLEEAASLLIREMQKLAKA